MILRIELIETRATTVEVDLDGTDYPSMNEKDKYVLIKSFLDQPLRYKEDVKESQAEQTEIIEWDIVES